MQAGEHSIRVLPQQHIVQAVHHGYHSVCVLIYAYLHAADAVLAVTIRVEAYKFIIKSLTLTRRVTLSRSDFFG